jgi:hypothetical protein
MKHGLIRNRRRTSLFSASHAIVEGRMNAARKGLLVAVLAVVFLAVASVSASADTGRDIDADYRDAMWALVTDLGRWSGQVEKTILAVEVKPELEVELQELARRGEFMVYDLEGTAAPESIAEAHERLLFAMRQLDEAAQIAAVDLAGAKLLLGTYLPMFEDARGDIRAFTMRGMAVRETRPQSAVVIIGG